MNKKEEFAKMLQDLNACQEATNWCKGRTLANAWAKSKHPSWMLWLYQRCNPKKSIAVEIAIFSAELCLKNYEDAYPKDKRPRLAIAAAKAVLKNDTEKTRKVAYSAADSAYSAARSAARSAAYLAADSAAYSAYSADSAACLAARSAARSAAYLAAESARSARSAKYSTIAEFIRTKVTYKDLLQGGNKR